MAVNLQPEVGGGLVQLFPGTLCPRDLCPRTVCPGDCPRNLSPRDVCPLGFCPRPCPRSPIFNFSVHIPVPDFPNLCPRPCPHLKFCINIVPVPSLSRICSGSSRISPHFFSSCRQSGTSGDRRGQSGTDGDSIKFHESPSPFFNFVSPFPSPVPIF